VVAKLAVNIAAGLVFLIAGHLYLFALTLPISIFWGWE